MTPIRPENRARYPKDWKAIRAGILVRAFDRCECTGECGAEHLSQHGLTGPSGERVHAETRCGAPDGALIERHPQHPEMWREATDAGGVRVVLTIAHLDHTPENNAPSNLRAFCQLCHNRYDTKHRQANAATTRHRKRGSLDLFAQEG